ncbi:MAG: MarR family transcriptional regulator [Flavobacteriaceae bacterium]|nr:MarR family transcriptional regulator [Flavobacteriaceae bacterium]
MIKKTTRDSILSVLKASLRINSKLYSILKKYNISEQQFNILRILRGRKNKPSNLITLQERMVHKMSNTTRLVDKLIIKKYVRRTLCKTNRRKIEIFITDKGLEVLSLIDPIIDKNEELLAVNLSEEEKKQLIYLSNKLAI